MRLYKSSRGRRRSARVPAHKADRSPYLSVPTAAGPPGLGPHFDTPRLRQRMLGSRGTCPDVEHYAWSRKQTIK